MMKVHNANLMGIYRNTRYCYRNDDLKNYDYQSQNKMEKHIHIHILLFRATISTFAESSRLPLPITVVCSTVFPI